MGKRPNGARTRWAQSALKHNSDECLVFPFPPGSHGYGEMRVDGKTILAHRYVCEVSHGPPPSSLHQAAHKCGNKLCMNRRHLRWATRRQNEADKLIHGTVSRGETHGHNRLTRKEVLQIRAAMGPQQEIAKRFGVVQQTVSDIKKRRRWAWL